MTGLVTKVLRWFSNPPTETNVEEPTVQNPVNKLKEWTGKASATIIYDSTVDEFTADGLFTKVKGKKYVALVGFTTDGDVFGAFYSVAVTEQSECYKDPTLFVFSFESRGRCTTPHRFALKKGLNEKVYVVFWKFDSNGFVWFGVFDCGVVMFGNEGSNSRCKDMSDAFEGLENTTLTGKNFHFPDGPFHHCARLIAIHLE